MSVNTIDDLNQLYQDNKEIIIHWLELQLLKDY